MMALNKGTLVAAAAAVAIGLAAPAAAMNMIGNCEMTGQKGALFVGSKHRVDEGLRSPRRLLGNGADARVPRNGDRSRFRVEVAEDEMQERRLADAVAADEPDLMASRYGDRRLVE